MTEKEILAVFSRVSRPQLEKTGHDSGVSRRKKSRHRIAFERCPRRFLAVVTVSLTVTWPIRKKGNYVGHESKTHEMSSSPGDHNIRKLYRPVRTSRFAPLLIMVYFIWRD